MREAIQDIQKKLREQGLDGWLLYDHHGSNKFARQLLGITSEFVLTRRFFYWIPQRGDPVKILHYIESESLAYLPGKTILYLSWIDLEKSLSTILKKAKRIAMEYSPRNANPYISIVDAGTMEVVREEGVEVVSSADLLQAFTSVLSDSQIESHLAAASVLQETVIKAWDLISDALRVERKITEYDVQEFILSEFAAHDCITEDGPICAANSHSAFPHYVAPRTGSKVIVRGDLVLIDLWCKKNHPSAVYADITRVAVADSHPTPRVNEIFEIVKSAQNRGIDLIRERFKKGKPLCGYEVDDVCRSYIEEQGFGANFPHRSGHNIDTSVHGSGAHLDNLETSDTRLLLPGTCCSLEPGIYLPGEFGIRLEYNILIRKDHSVEITGGREESIVCLI